METAKGQTKSRFVKLALGIFCGFAALAALAFTWNRELHTIEIALILGLFCLSVPLLFTPTDKQTNRTKII